MAELLSRVSPLCLSSLLAGGCRFVPVRQLAFSGNRRLMRDKKRCWRTASMLSTWLKLKGNQSACVRWRQLFKYDICMPPAFLHFLFAHLVQAFAEALACRARGLTSQE